jgi:hypothetical protein
MKVEEATLPDRREVHPIAEALHQASPGVPTPAVLLHTPQEAADHPLLHTPPGVEGNTISTWYHLVLIL